MKRHVFLRNIGLKGVWGGCEKQLLDYFLKVDYRFNKLIFVTTNDIFSRRFKEHNLPIQVIKFPFDACSCKMKFRFRFMAMFKLLKSLKPDNIIYVQGTFLKFTLADFLSGFVVARGNIFSMEVLGAPAPLKKASRKHLGFIPGLGLWWYKQMLPITLRGWLCKRILAVSKAVKERMVEWYYYPERRIVPVYHGVDAKRFFPDSRTRQIMRERLNIPEDHIIIISTARFSQEKCLHRLVNAFDALYGKFKNCWLIFAGDGELRGQLEELSNQKQSREKIRFLGYQENTSDFLKMSDVFVLPSDNEGLSNAMLEAMATELICVVTRTPGTDEVIENGINGFIVEPSEEGVSIGLKKALSLSQSQRSMISQEARRLIRVNFDLELGLQRVLEVLGLGDK